MLMALQRRHIHILVLRSNRGPATRRRKEVIIGGQIHYIDLYADTDVKAIKFGVLVFDVFMIVIC